MKNELLRADKKERGFVQSLADPCILLKQGIIVVCYVDDCLMFAPTKNQIDSLRQSLAEDFMCTDEGLASACLGVKIKKFTNHLKLTQPFLTQRIITQTGLQDGNIKDAPIVKPLLTKDIDVKPRDKNSFHYRSVVGMLSCLAGATRPDISMSTHQVGKFSSNPMNFHDAAVKRIIKYLKGTVEKGIIMNPDIKQGLQCFVDADFAGAHNKNTADDPNSVFPRTGYLTKCANCLVLWTSKLQS